MKRFFLFFVISACALVLKAQSSYETGISQELAEHRAATIHNLEYSLFFSIPENKAEDISASEVVSFSLDAPEEIALDFREAKEKIHSVHIAGKKKSLEWRFENEHLIIPAKYTRQGENAFRIEFTAGNQSLNRNEEYMYTLFVPDRARTCFPCFDQPDLKAKFHLTLEIPEAWTAVANDPLSPLKGKTKAGRKLLTTEQGISLPLSKGRGGKGGEAAPLPTYLFAFAAGKFQYQSYECTLPSVNGKSSEGGSLSKGEGGGRGFHIGAYYRETDPLRVKQLPEIFRQVEYALRWQEEFTGQPYGFSKYDFVVLPGFQFGGMEHTGCTFYNDNTLFLSENPTPDEILSRANLISHETSHMWFGDLVTMRWFDDVWTKEVFANYFAAEITHPQFPDVNYDLYWLKNFKQAAITEDRTEGRTAIQQPLDNMRNAGLIYNNIIYNKAPLVMREMVRMMGQEAFQRGIQRYVHDYAYGNATWDDLIRILDSEAPQVGLKEYSDLWVKQPYYPTIKATTFRPNPDGREYGYFELSPSQLDSLMSYWPSETDATARQSYLMTLYDNYLHGLVPDHRWSGSPASPRASSATVPDHRWSGSPAPPRASSATVPDHRWSGFILNALPSETDPLTLSTLVSYLQTPIWRLDSACRDSVEARLWDIAQTHPVKSCRLQLLRFLSQNGNSDFINKQMYVLWRYKESELLSERDYMTMAYELAVRYPALARDILNEEAGRIINPDRYRQFQYISRAVSPDESARDSLFQWLLVPENRRIEPWAGSALYYLNHPLRDVESTKYILPALEALQDVQRTGDIFFPGRWCNSLLGGHRSKQALSALNSFLSSHPDYPPLLRNKILVAAYNLQRQ